MNCKITTVKRIELSADIRVRPEWDDLKPWDLQDEIVNEFTSMALTQEVDSLIGNNDIIHATPPTFGAIVNGIATVKAIIEVKV